MGASETCKCNSRWFQQIQQWEAIETFRWFQQIQQWGRLKLLGGFNKYNNGSDFGRFNDSKDRDGFNFRDRRGKDFSGRDNFQNNNNGNNNNFGGNNTSFRHNKATNRDNSFGGQPQKGGPPRRYNFFDPLLFFPPTLIFATQICWFFTTRIVSEHKTKETT